MSSPVDLETSEQISRWRMAAESGELTKDDMKAIILKLRAGRVAAASASAASAKTRKKSIAVIPHADDLLGEIEGM